MAALESLRLFLPETFLLLGAFFVLILDLVVKNKKGLGLLSILILLLTAILSQAPTKPADLFYGYFQLDAFSHFFRLAALGIVAVSILISFAYKRLPSNYEGEFYGLFLLMAFALILMGASTNLLMIFLSVEFVSILSYLMVGFLKTDGYSKEAALKYLLFGSLCSGIMLFGMSLLFGISGSLELDTIGIALNAKLSWVHFVSFFFILTGLGFKISMGPFHMWAPDAYQAAPTPVTAFLTVGPKALGFALLIRVLGSAFGPLSWKWTEILIFFSILTMTIGNVIAVGQTNIKRLLAYSSIAQAGYMLMGLCVFNQTGLSGILFYLVAYAFTNLGAFIVVIIASNHFQNDEIESYAGLAQRNPFLAASLTIFLLSLAGIPPLAGFVGKFFVFSSALEGGLVSLAVAAALNSAVAGFYYFKIVRVMYLMNPLDATKIPQPLSLTFALILMLAGTIAIGLMPSPLILLARSALV